MIFFKKVLQTNTKKIKKFPDAVSRLETMLINIAQFAFRDVLFK